MLSADLQIDRNSPVPLHRQVAQAIEAAINDGRLAPGDRIDSELTLSAMLHLSRPTMRQAIDSLVRRGLLVRKRGVGTQVVGGSVERPVELTSLFDDLIASKRQPTTDVTSFSLRQGEADEVNILHLPPGANIYHITRIRSVDGEPLALMENWLSGAIVGITADLLRTHGLYQVLRRSGVYPKVASQSIGATVADTEQASMLGIDDGAPLITMERTVSDDNGKIIETARHLYRADLYKFEMTLVQR